MLTGQSASTNRLHVSVWAFTLKMSHAPMAVRDVVLNTPPARHSVVSLSRHAEGSEKYPSSLATSFGDAEPTHTGPNRRVIDHKHSTNIGT